MSAHTARFSEQDSIEFWGRQGRAARADIGPTALPLNTVPAVHTTTRFHKCCYYHKSFIIIQKNSVSEEIESFEVGKTEMHLANSSET